MYLKPLVVWTDATFQGMFCFKTRRVSTWESIGAAVKRDAIARAPNSVRFSMVNRSR